MFLFQNSLSKCKSTKPDALIFLINDLVHIVFAATFITAVRCRRSDTFQHETPAGYY
jgi:hypothetical protein